MGNVKDQSPVRLWQLVRYFLRLGATGFGGPIALAGSMQRDLVPRGWISQQEYVEGLAFAQMMPGPLAAQLAMWIGFIRFGVPGASLVGLAFIVPAFLIVLGVAYLYDSFNGLTIVQALFYGIGPAVIAIVAHSAIRLARSTVGSDRLMWVVFAISALITFVSRTEVAVLFVVAGLFGMLLYSPPAWLRRRANFAPAVFLSTTFVGAVSLPLLLDLGGFFVIAGAFTFGSGLAIVPFLHQGVVIDHQWLTERQFLDAVAVGIITPGPVVITAAFVGYLVAGFWGALVAAGGVFLPVYFFVLVVGRFIIKYRTHPALKGFVKGATAAASGAIAGAAVILAQNSVVDIPTALIAVACILLIWRTRKIPDPLLVAAAGAVGIFLYRG